MVSGRDNNKFNIIGPNFETEVELGFDNKNKSIKAIKAQYKDDVLNFFWIYFENNGELNVGKISNENLELESSSVIISNETSLTDLKVLDNELFVSTITGEVYSVDVIAQDFEKVVVEKFPILALAADTKFFYFTKCTQGESILVSKSISKSKMYNTPLCFQDLDIDQDAEILYATAFSRIYSWKISKGNFTEIHKTVGEIRNLVNGDEYLYFRAQGNRCFKLDKKDNNVVEMSELCAVSHSGPIAYFKAPVFVTPPPATQPTTTEITTTETATTQATSLTTNATKFTNGTTFATVSSITTAQTTKSIIPPHEKSWFLINFWWLIFLLLLIIIIFVVVIVIICVCRKKKKKNYEQM